MPKRGHRIVGRAALAIVLLLVIALAACKPTGGVAVDTGGSRFAVELVEVGVRFDEPVVVVGSDAAVGPGESASVILVRNEDDESFSTRLGATDTSGNQSETHLEVRILSIAAAAAE